MSFPAGNGPQLVTTADFNQDGHLDLAVANFYSDDVSVLLGNGLGSFRGAVSFPAGDRLLSVTAADFNEDGHLDLAVASFLSDDVSVLLVDGLGSFGGAVSFPAGNSPSSVTTADFNEDGHVDLGAANILSDNVTVYLTACPPTANLDIKPGSCPNSMNRSPHGFLKVALLGTADFDAALIDATTVLLSRAVGVGGSVAVHVNPHNGHLAAKLKDPATPFDGEPCDCHDLGDDGFIDLELKFHKGEVVPELELLGLPPGTQLELVVTGNLLDKTPFVSTGDCIRLVGPAGDLDGDGSVGILDLFALLAGRDTDPGGPPDFSGSGTVDIFDLLILLANWGPC